MSNSETTGLDSLWHEAEVIMVAGPGGVGKTSLAAALGVAAASRTDRRVLVVTVDPARRLADALGVDLPGNRPTRVELGAAGDHGGELWAGMLNVRAGWDELIARHAPSPEVAERILADPLYRNLTRRFVHSHDYLAMERLHEVTSGREFDLVIVDTPPSRNAMDLLDAPVRMREFFGSRLIRWLTAPSRSRVARWVSQPFHQIADRLLGPGFLADITEFFSLFQTMEGSFVTHARQVEATVASPRTRFVVVSTAEVAPVHEARFLITEIARRGLHLGAVIANRLTDPVADPVADSGIGPAADHVAETESEDLEPLVAAILAGLAQDSDRDPLPATSIRELLVQLRARAGEISELAHQQEDLVAELGAEVALVLRCPILDTDVRDLDDVWTMAAHLRGEG